jgi:hypothetical protein
MSDAISKQNLQQREQFHFKIALLFLLKTNLLYNMVLKYTEICFVVFFVCSNLQGCCQHIGVTQKGGVQTYSQHHRTPGATP